MLSGFAGQDALSELLHRVQLRGQDVLRCAPTPPFAIAMPGTSRVLHVVEDGHLELELVADRSVIRLEPGTMALIATGTAHIVRWGAASAPRQLRADDLAGAESTTRSPRWISGTFAVDDELAEPILSVLPPVIVVPRTELGAAWLDLSVALIIAELDEHKPGSSVMISRILDLLFVHALRDWAASPAARPGWLTAAMDPSIGRALVAMHTDPARRWSVAELARTARLSRTLFAERFTRLIGEPPASYLTGLRLEHAALLLRTTDRAVFDIGELVGYSSEAAFSRAFSRRFEHPPARWRRRSREG